MQRPWFDAEDASRSNVDFLRKVFLNAIDHNVDRLCVCDTVGILTPDSSFELFTKLKDLQAPISCHCHNDFGLAVANTLSAIKGGANEIHTTVNGIGERAGNTSFEECIVSIDRLLPEFSTNVKISEIYDISKLVARTTGVYIQPNKAIVGENAFAHESGIHSDGIIKNSATYEPITPELVGRKRKFILGKHMGTHGLDSRLKELGLNESGLDKLIKASYKLLGLMSFLTAGQPEVRAWTIKIGTKAPEAAGKIHSDIQRGFIRAEVINYKELLEQGSLTHAREKGLVRSEGKEYIMQNGDVVLFRFNV